MNDFSPKNSSRCEKKEKKQKTDKEAKLKKLQSLLIVHISMRVKRYKYPLYVF